MRLGAHNSIAGGVYNAIDQAVEVGGECMQIFCKNQRQFRAKPLPQEDAARFKEARAAAGIDPVMVHDSYLINMGNPDDEKRAGAVAAFIDELERCTQLDVDFLNFHPGSHVHKKAAMRDDPAERRACLDRIAAGMQEAADAVPSKVMLVIENAAGQGTNVGSSWEEVGHLVDAANLGDRVGVCVDTQHAWAAGYDWIGDYDGVFGAFDDHVGLRHLVAFHLNDSKQPRGARVDRHDNIPDGALGPQFWEHLMQDARFDNIAGFLETPLVDEDIATWRDELAYLRRLRAGETVRAPGQMRLG